MKKFTTPEIDIEFIVKNAPGYVYWKNLDSVYIGCNQNCATLIGLKTPSDIIGLHESSMPWAKMNPSTVAHNINADQRVILTHEKVITEECLGIKNESGLPIILRSEKSPLIDRNGAVVGILGVSIDITDTKEKERLIQLKLNEEVKFRQIIDLVEASIYWKDTKGYMLGCNQHVLDMFGANSREVVIGKNEYDLLPKEEAIQISKIDNSVLKNGSYRGEEIFTIAGGIQKIYFTVKNRLLDNSGNVIGIVGTSLDITSQKKEQAKFLSFIDKIQHDIQNYKIEALTEKIGVIPKISSSDKQIRLTKRELDILYYLSLHKSPKDIAQIITIIENKPISDSTINAIINKKLYTKFGVFNIGQLVEKAILLDQIPFLLENSSD
ncbi:MAG: sensor histidine kinase [Burkholderiales bacterium]|jgi:PAS domain S-box-containing protein|nr:sensor histidine kinase [Burkholderiales bacterium]